MYKIYFKQSVRTLRQNPVMSLIAITGTALAIMMIMTIIVSEEVKNIPIAPEINRNRTYYVDYYSLRDSAGNRKRAGMLNYDIFREYLTTLKTPEAISGITFYMQEFQYPLSLPSSQKIIKGIVRGTDHSFWKIYSLNFLEGTAFTPENFHSGIKEAVVTESIARKLFNSTRVTGEEIIIAGKPYRIIGVVEDISALFNNVYSEVWVPYTSDPEWNSSVTAIFLLKSKKDHPALAGEIREIEKKFTSNSRHWMLNLKGPENHRINQMKATGWDAGEIQEVIHIQYRRKYTILLILLLIPAINLSGLNLSRMKKRTEEIGIRKAFGAKKRTILIQVLFENLITSIIGGIIGLILSCFMVLWMKNWLLDIPAEHSVPFSTLISFPVIVAICLICILFNLLSAGIPTWKAAQTTIIDSLTQNNKQV